MKEKEVLPIGKPEHTPVRMRMRTGIKFVQKISDQNILSIEKDDVALLEESDEFLQFYFQKSS